MSKINVIASVPDVHIRIKDFNDNVKEELKLEANTSFIDEKDKLTLGVIDYHKELHRGLYCDLIIDQAIRDGTGAIIAHDIKTYKDIVLVYVLSNYNIESTTDTTYVFYK